MLVGFHIPASLIASHVTRAEQRIKPMELVEDGKPYLHAGKASCDQGEPLIDIPAIRSTTIDQIGW